MLDRHFRSAEAVTVRNGRVLAVGRMRDLRRLAGRRTQLLDAGGGTVLPGINDSHLHLAAFGLNRSPFTYNVDTATIPELVAAVQQAAAEAPEPDSWIRGQGWNDNRLPRPPRASDLDPVSGDHPVLLTDFSVRAVAVNSIVLRLAGITRDTVPPTGGVIEKDADGEPTGVFRETAQGLVRGLVPPFTREQTPRGIDTVVGIRLNALLGAGSAPSQLRELLAAYEPLQGVDPRWLRVAGIKIFADGIPTTAKTAWLHEPYLDGSNGSLVVNGDTVGEQVANLHELIRIANDAGLRTMG